MLKIIVVGTGRSGTGYMAKLLTSAGFNCSHEDIFGGQVINIAHIFDPFSPFVAASSWLAVPFLGSPFLKDVKIIHAVRNPLDVIQSHLTNNFYHKNSEQSPWLKYQLLFEPELQKHLDNPVDAATFHYLNWNRKILEYENHPDYVRHRIEDSPLELIQSLGGDVSDLFSDNKYNSFGHSDNTITFDEIGIFRNELQLMARKFGYD